VTSQERTKEVKAALRKVTSQERTKEVKQEGCQPTLVEEESL